MLRVMNFFCIALMGLSILALYHVSEKARVAGVELSHVGRDIRDEKRTLGVLETEWQRVAGPERIQQLAQSRLGMSDTASVQLSSLEMLPRRGVNAPVGDTPLRAASAILPRASMDTAVTGGF